MVNSHLCLNSLLSFHPSSPEARAPAQPGLGEEGTLALGRNPLTEAVETGLAHFATNVKVLPGRCFAAWKGAMSPKPLHGAGRGPGTPGF